MTPQSYSVYLGGPPAVVNPDPAEYRDWRQHIAGELPEEIGVTIPLCGGGNRHPTGSLNYYNCGKADVVVFNFLDQKKVPLQSCIEIGWAEANRIPIVFVADLSHRSHELKRLTQDHCNWETTSLDTAVTIVKSILRPLGPWNTRCSL